MLKMILLALAGIFIAACSTASRNETAYPSIERIDVAVGRAIHFGVTGSHLDLVKSASIECGDLKRVGQIEWQREGRIDFQVEEIVLLPAYRCTRASILLTDQSGRVSRMALDYDYAKLNSEIHSDE